MTESSDPGLGTIVPRRSAMAALHALGRVGYLPPLVRSTRRTSTDGRKIPWAGSLALPSQIVATTVPTAVTKASVQVAQAHLERGEALSEARDYTAAIAAYTSAIRLKPDFAEAYNNRGFAHYLNKNAERAIADFTRAIELRPSYPKADNS